MDYPKIQTLFKRDENGKIIRDRYTLEEFHYLKNNYWECTEKIDGTNIHIDFTLTSEGIKDITFNGRTENALIPARLLNRLKELFTEERLIKGFRLPLATESKVAIYGEGYGVKIQSGGGYLKDKNDFIIFDILIDGLWLERSAIENIANGIGISIVPLLGYFTLIEAIKITEKGFNSTIAEDEQLKAEGMVLKPVCGILRRNSDRLITKLKTRDFKP